MIFIRSNCVKRRIHASRDQIRATCSDFRPWSRCARCRCLHCGRTGRRSSAGQDQTADGFQYQNSIFIAEHGSWNRSVPIGYRVTRVSLNGNRAERYEVFAEGWLQGDTAWGRPVDVMVMPDGALLVSDDRAGAIYRIAYSPL